MSYDQEKELRLSFEPYTAATTGAVGKKKSIIFGVASRCITSDMLQTFKKQIILQWHAWRSCNSCSFFMNVDIIYIYETSSLNFIKTFQMCGTFYCRVGKVYCDFKQVHWIDY